MEIKISHSKPPHYAKMLKAFPAATWDKPVAFAYKDTIYTNVEKVEAHLIVHEATHLKQQELNLDEWIDLYIKDPAFRLKQEIEAYGNQYKWVRARTPVKVYDNFLDQCADALSSPLYNNIISFAEARSKIRHG